MNKYKRSTIFLSLIALGLSSSFSLSQTVTPPLTPNYLVDQKVPSLRAPFGYIVPYSIIIQMEKISSTTGKPVTTGTAFTLPSMDFVNDNVILVDLIGSKSLEETIPSLSVTLKTNKADFWEQKAPWGFRVFLDKPFTLPMKQVVGCRYDMPAQGFSLTKSLVETIVNMGFVIVWDKEVTGNLRCLPGVKAASITPPGPAPVSTIPPTNIPPATTPGPGTPPGTGITPPATTVVANKPGDSICPVGCNSTELILADGSKWTFSAPKIFRNNADVTLNAYPDVKRLSIFDNGKLCVDGSVHGYMCWNGTNWGS